MEGLEKFAREQVEALLPAAKIYKLRATVSDTSYSVEFFAECDGRKKQCFELADEGIVSEKELNGVLAAIAGFIRRSGEYRAGEVNSVSFGFNG